MKRVGFNNSDDQPGLSKELHRRPCMVCKSSTLITMLSEHGARCLKCYGSYCLERQPEPSTMGNKMRGDHKDWAKALEARENRGERLTKVQKQAWRTALRKD